MKGKGKKNISKYLNIRTIMLALLVVLSTAFFAFGGLKTVHSALVDMQKRLDPNEELGRKTLSDNEDGTYKLSLTVTGDSIKEVQHVNVVVIVDRSGSMGYNTVYYTESNDQGNQQPC